MPQIVFVFFSSSIFVYFIFVDGFCFSVAFLILLTYFV